MIRKSLDALYLFGDLMKNAADAATRAGLKTVKHFATRAELGEALSADLLAGDGVLAKGSRSMKMDEVVGLLVAKRGAA